MKIVKTDPPPKKVDTIKVPLLMIDKDEEIIVLITDTSKSNLPFTLCEGVVLWSKEETEYTVGDFSDDFTLDELTPFLGKLVLSND